MRSADRLKRLIKPLLGIGLLLLVFSQLETDRVEAALLSANWSWFAAALLLALMANLACALRWQRIVGDFNFQISPRAALKLYFQGVTANTILPGGIIGGDILRTMGLAGLGLGKLAAAQTVFFDRASGFWSLSVLSSLALMLTWFDGAIHAPRPATVVYGVAMLGIAMGPLVLWPVQAARSRLVLNTAAVSLLSQALTIAAFTACLWSVGVSIAVLPVAAVCAGIFLAAVVPASIGGFGSREVASLFFLSTLNVDLESAFLASCLFGITATLQGLLGLLTFMNQSPASSR